MITVKDTNDKTWLFLSCDFFFKIPAEVKKKGLHWIRNHIINLSWWKQNESKPWWWNLANSEKFVLLKNIWIPHFDGLLQERHNSCALAMELCLSCTNPSIWWPMQFCKQIRTEQFYTIIISLIAQILIYVSSCLCVEMCQYHTRTPGCWPWSIILHWWLSIILRNLFHF